MFMWELKKSKWEVYYKTTGEMKLSGRSKLQYNEILKCRNSGGIADFVYPENFEDKINELLSSL